MNRLKLLQIFNSYTDYGGEEAAFYRITDALASSHQVETFVTSSHSLTATPFRRLAAPVLTLYNPFVAARLRRLQATHRFDAWIVHNVFPTMSPEVYRLAFSLGVPVVQYLHNYRLSCANAFFLNHGKPCTACIEGHFSTALRTACWRGSHVQSGWMGLVLRRVRRLGVFDGVRSWIAISEAQKALHVRMGIPEERIHVVPHFFDGPPPDPTPAVTDSRTVLFIGRLSTEKGVHVLLEAWSKVRTPDAKLVVVGDGPERGNLETKAAELNLRNVEFAGFLPGDQQTSIWRSAGISVVPSIWEEPFGLVVFEAWNQGLTPIVSRIGGLREIVDHGRNGLHVEPGDPSALAFGIDRLLAAPEERRAMSANGARDLSQRFSKDRWIAAVQAILAGSVNAHDQLGPGEAAPP